MRACHFDCLSRIVESAVLLRPVNGTLGEKVAKADRLDPVELAICSADALQSRAWSLDDAVGQAADCWGTAFQSAHSQALAEVGIHTLPEGAGGFAAMDKRADVAVAVGYSVAAALDSASVVLQMAVAHSYAVVADSLHQSRQPVHSRMDL